MKLRATLIAAILCVAGPAMAQTTPSTQPAPQHAPATPAQPGQTRADAPPAPAAEKIDPAKEAAIRHLMDITEVSKMGDSISTGITTQVRNVIGRALPADQLPKFMDEFTQKFTASAPSSAVTDAMVPVYAKHFSTEDIQDLTKFYETPLGQRVVKVMPEVAQQSQTAGAQLDQKAAIAALRSMSDEYPQLKQMLPPDPSAPAPAPNAAPAPNPAPAPAPAPAPKLAPQPQQPQH